MGVLLWWCGTQRRIPALLVFGSFLSFRRQRSTPGPAVAIEEVVDPRAAAPERAMRRWGVDAERLRSTRGLRSLVPRDPDARSIDTAQHLVVRPMVGGGRADGEHDCHERHLEGGGKSSERRCVVFTSTFPLDATDVWMGQRGPRGFPGAWTSRTTVADWCEVCSGGGGRVKERCGASS